MCVLSSNLNLNRYFAFYCRSSPSCATHHIASVAFSCQNWNGYNLHWNRVYYTRSHALAPNYSLWFLLPVNQDAFFRVLRTDTQTHIRVCVRCSKSTAAKVDMYALLSPSSSMCMSDVAIKLLKKQNAIIHYYL